MKKPSVNGERLIESLETMARIGATEKGGVCRLAGTTEDGDARNLFVDWAKKANCDVTVDQVGNLFCQRRGRHPELSPVILGSHLDSQPTGGKYDGAFGVLAALEVIRALNDSNIETDRPIEAVSWTNEEGSRFPPAMMGSAVFTGALKLSDALSAKDLDGCTLQQSLDQIGYAGSMPCGNKPAHAYFEAHIEQGPILEAESKIIGVVEGIQGIRWFDCTLVGEEAHAGPTPMPARRNALSGAAHLVQQIEAIANDHEPNGRTTVGQFQVFPNSRNVIPGRVCFTVDMRHPDPNSLVSMKDSLQAQFKLTCEKTKLEGKLEEIWYSPPTHFEQTCIEDVERAALLHQYSNMRIISGAGHDAKYMAEVCPTAMVFIPCKDGLSHNELEDAADDHLIAGAQVLLEVALTKAMETE